jgi:hypothetical protein
MTDAFWCRYSFVERDEHIRPILGGLHQQYARI